MFMKMSKIKGAEKMRIRKRFLIQKAVCSSSMLTRCLSGIGLKSEELSKSMTTYLPEFYAAIIADKQNRNTIDHFRFC